ncbi:MAG: PepSY domain-containing protein [Firmicutes bacterium]|nr:PepSY domain-containing protein [Bacillota bacterium]
MKGLLNKRNAIIAGVVVLVIIAVVVASTSFSSGMNLDKAKEIAQGYVPASAKFISSEEEDRYFEVAFYDEAGKEHFEVEVIKETGEVKKVESQLSNDGGSNTIVLTEEEAQKAVKDRFDGITSSSAILTKDNGLFEYEVSFKGDGFYGDADVNAESGAILDSVVKYGSVVTIPADTSKKAEMLTYDEAKEAVIKEAGGGTVRDMDLDKENGDYFYEIELHIDGMERDYIVNAKTGEVMLESEHQCVFEHHNDDPYEVKEEYVPEQEAASSQSASADAGQNHDNGLISEDEAKEIVRAKVPGAEFVEFYLERDDGIYQYEGTAHADGFEYEFEINAASGIIIGWDKETIEYDEWDD